ncbi:MAG: tRNA (guanosine(37)-N1)-methyltransferase TrmD [Clostridiaceae bacterium]|jgi:tRNA (guanine37-N1)-methyltransferase|nr:tRNA (guanosine(37)-N1)-methyltransferase TrmD [Clostridiaceae bacterium]
MIFDVLTLFPEDVDRFLSGSIIGRAREKGILTVRTHNIRDFSQDKHKKVDDYPYGGGGGMVMTPQPIHDAWLHVTRDLPYKPKTIYMSPQGKVLNQDIAKELMQEEHIIILCGHYEGVDERILEEIVDEEISIGDYVLTGGELPAMVLIDCVSRMVQGVLPSEEAFSDESHFHGLLEYPQYTRPPEYLEKSVPDILLSGHHANIEKWRFEKRLERTRDRRPDLYEKYIREQKGDQK